MKEKGFTLIELLAVIVILAVISLIATPMVLGVIEKSTERAEEISATGYIDALEQQILVNEMDSSKEFIVDGIYEVSELTNLGVNIKGNKPSENSWVKIENGKVASCSLKFKNYTVTLDGGIITKEKGDNIATKPYNIYINGTPIYYNPETNKVCLESEATFNVNLNGIPTNIKTGCMKWYIFNDGGDKESTVNMILDHNTTALVSWNSSGNNHDGMKEVKDSLISDTSTWNSEIKSTARLITADEIAKITGNKNFDSTTSTHDDWFYLDSNSHTQLASNENLSKYSWLYNYTMDCVKYGCSFEDDATHGYWTSDPVIGGYSGAWSLKGDGYLFDYGVGLVTEISGLRPVITVKKSVIS